MTLTRNEYISLPIANKSHHCSKAKCQRSLPKNQPILYTNGLCERHFFEMNLSSNDIDNDKNIHLNHKSKLSSKEKKLYTIKYHYQPLKNDIRTTREVFDGNRWQIIEQKIDNQSTKIIDDDKNLPTIMTKNDKEKDFLQIFQLITNYQMILDELKEKI